MDENEIFIKNNLSEILSILDNIRKKTIITPREDLLRYVIKDFFSKDRQKAMSVIKEDEILYKLAEWGAFKIKGRESLIDESEEVYLIAITPNFEEWYDNFIKIFNRRLKKADINEESAGHADIGDTFNADQEYNREMNNLLQKIKYEIKKRGKNNSFFLITTSKEGCKTTEHESDLLILKLENLKAIKAIPDKFSSGDYVRDASENIIDVVQYQAWGYRIKSIEPKFSRLCDEYEKKVNETLNEKTSFHQEIGKQIKKYQKNGEPTPFDNIPPNITWENIEIRYINSNDIDIFINTKHYQKSDFERMGFYDHKKKQDKKPDMQWQFLQKLSTANGSFDLKQFSNIKEKDKYRQYKIRISKQFQMLFHINEDPFGEKNGEYQTKFKISPEPILRGSGETYGIRDISQDDNEIQDYMEEETQKKSVNHKVKTNTTNY